MSTPWPGTIQGEASDANAKHSQGVFQTGADHRPGGVTRAVDVSGTRVVQPQQDVRRTAYVKPKPGSGKDTVMTRGDWRK